MFFTAMLSRLSSGLSLARSEAQQPLISEAHSTIVTSSSVPVNISVPVRSTAQNAESPVSYLNTSIIFLLYHFLFIFIHVYVYIYIYRSIRRMRLQVQLPMPRHSIRMATNLSPVLSQAINIQVSEADWDCKHNRIHVPSPCLVTVTTNLKV